MKNCSIKYAMNILSGKWKMYIMFILSENDTIRFNELQRQVGNISALMLSRSLKELEDVKLIKKQVFNVVPPHVEYSLTKLGKELSVSLEALNDWGHKVWLANGSPTD